MAKAIIVGDKKLQRILDKLPGVVQRKLVRKALRAGAKMVLASAKSKVPVDEGALKKGLKVKAMKRRKNRMGIVVEHPTRERLAALQKDKKKAERILTEKGYYPAAVEYGAPHMAARPHLRPALNENRAPVVATFRQELAQNLAAEAKKL